MNGFNFIFLLTCYPLLFLLYFFLRNARNHNGWCFGVSLTSEWKKDPEIDAIDVEYRKDLKNTMIVFGIMPVVTFFMKHMSISFTFWMIWITVICFLPMYWYAKANKQIRVLKDKRGWNAENKISYTDLKIAALPRRVKLITFLPCMVISVLSIVLSYVLFKEEGYGAFRICVWCFGLCTFLFYVAAIWTDKLKVSVICEDTDTNMNYARAKKKVWKNFWLNCTWSNTIYTLFILVAMYFRTSGITWVIWGSVIYCVAIVVLSGWLMKKLFAINNAYEDKRTLGDATDDDRHWYWGIIYYNPKDTRFMVENRMGTGTAVNMAKPSGKAMYVFAALCMLIIPVSCVWMIMLDFTPINTQVKNDRIVCEHLSVEYEIPIADIENYTVITELPEMTKMRGNGMDHVLSGTFEIYRVGEVETFLNPQNNLFIKIETEDEIYYISGVDNAETQNIIEVLQKIE